MICARAPWLAAKVAENMAGMAELDQIRERHPYYLWRPRERAWNNNHWPASSQSASKPVDLRTLFVLSI